MMCSREMNLSKPDLYQIDRWNGEGTEDRHRRTLFFQPKLSLRRQVMGLSPKYSINGFLQGLGEGSATPWRLLVNSFTFWWLCQKSTFNAILVSRTYVPQLTPAIMVSHQNKNQNQTILLVTHHQTFIHLGQRLRRLVSRPHKWCDSSERVLRTFSKGYYRCREYIPIPNGIWEETVLVNVSSSIWHLKCHWMLIPTTPIRWLKFVTRYTSSTFQTFE